MAREALEESSLVIDPNDIKVAHVMHRRLSDNVNTREYVDFFMTVDSFA